MLRNFNSLEAKAGMHDANPMPTPMFSTLIMLSKRLSGVFFGDEVGRNKAAKRSGEESSEYLAFLASNLVDWRCGKQSRQAKYRTLVATDIELMSIHGPLNETSNSSIYASNNLLGLSDFLSLVANPNVFIKAIHLHINPFSAIALGYAVELVTEDTFLSSNIETWHPFKVLWTIVK
ncbi:hypothetical protein PIB30_053839, partial [Stylosanthes scabra]|nr:hypothetical protein [Stylosanthes scabra]